MSQSKPRSKRRAVVSQKECVACGCCEKICPLSAIHIFGGMYAVIEEAQCVGCGKCQIACPASVIAMEERI